MDFFYRNVTGVQEPHRIRDRPMKVLALGMSRCGTDSLRLALKKLGFEDTYHGFLIFEKYPEDAALWVKWTTAKLKRGLDAPPLDIPAEQWDRMLGHCMAVTDAPCAVFGQELINAYPDAKVILNRRDPEKWFISYKNTSFTAANSWFLWFISLFDKTFYYIVKGTRQTVFKYWGGNDFLDYGIEKYQRHYERMESMLKPGTWLDWQVEDGWGPLCEFLEKPVPKEPFPNLNDTKGFEDRVHRTMAGLAQRSYRNIGVFVVTMSACGIALWKGNAFSDILHSYRF